MKSSAGTKSLKVLAICKSSYKLKLSEKEIQWKLGFVLILMGEHEFNINSIARSVQNLFKFVKELDITDK